MASSVKLQIILFFLVLFLSKTACFFEFLKGNRNSKENDEANQKALRQKQIQTERGNQEKVKHLDKIARTRGVPLNEFDRYTKEIFVCDGSRKLPLSTVNDGFCDCNDGTDEPGTSACSNSIFYCLNDGYRMTKLTSSRVDDQICDCCDGSDEGETPINKSHFTNAVIIFLFIFIYRHPGFLPEHLQASIRERETRVRSENCRLSLRQ